MNDCRKLYQFIDYFHDHPYRKNIGDTKFKEKDKQLPKCIIDATLYKMKADYLRYIYECVSGEDSLLNDLQ